MINTSCKALFFDVGGVVIDINFERAIDAWASYSYLDRDELNYTFRTDTLLEQYGCGRIETTDYIEHLSRILQLKASAKEIERGWNSIFTGEIQSTCALVKKLQGTLPCFALTNTNNSHMSTLRRRYPHVVNLFKSIFASHELGVRKPDRAAFDMACYLSMTPASSVILFDDQVENVIAANEIGITGVLVRMPSDISRHLESIGLPSEA